MFMLGVIVVALSVLFGLTALALGASDKLAHPVRVALSLGAALTLGIWFLLD